MIMLCDVNKRTPILIFILSDGIVLHRCFASPFAVIMDVPATMNGYLNSGHVTLTCEVYGFLRSTNPLKWMDGEGNLLTNSAKYMIMSTTSSQPAVLVPSRTSTEGQRSTLTINQLSDGDEGNYTCVADGNSTTILLQVIPGSAPTTTMSSKSHHVKEIDTCLIGCG